MPLYELPQRHPEAHVLKVRLLLHPVGQQDVGNGFAAVAMVSSQSLGVSEHLHPRLVAPVQSWLLAGLAAVQSLSTLTLQTHLHERLQPHLVG